MIQKIFLSIKGKSGNFTMDAHDPTNGDISAHRNGISSMSVEKLRTLQCYQGGPNQERMAFMEAHSALTKRNRPSSLNHGYFECISSGDLHTFSSKGEFWFGFVRGCFERKTFHALLLYRLMHHKIICQTVLADS